MRILFVHNSLPEYRLQWFKNMSKMEEFVFLITNSELAKKIYKVDGERYFNGDFECVFCESGLKGYVELIKFLSKEHFDFVEMPPIDSLGEFIKACILLAYAKKGKIKTGYFWEKWVAPKCEQPFKKKCKNAILGAVAKVIYKRVDVVFSSGTKNREYFIDNGISDNKIKWIPDCCECPECEHINIRETYGLPEGARIILYFGRIIQRKGLDILIRAFERVEKENGNVYLLVAGDGEYREYCEQLAGDMKLTNICFVGRVEPHLRYNFFSQCDFFVHPATFFGGYTEVWGLTLNEAVQCGKVIISTNAVGSAYDLINEKNGFMVEAANVEQLETVIKKCVESDTIVESARVEGERLYSIYNSRNMAETYVQICRQVVVD